MALGWPKWCLGLGDTGKSGTQKCDGKVRWLTHEHLKDIGKRLPLMLSSYYKESKWYDESG